MRRQAPAQPATGCSVAGAPACNAHMPPFRRGPASSSNNSPYSSDVKNSRVRMHPMSAMAAAS